MAPAGPSACHLPRLGREGPMYIGLGTLLIIIILLIILL